jgi:hypothetical protein
MAKWASRFALGLSNSVPGIIIARNNIMFLKDEGLLSLQFNTKKKFLLTFLQFLKVQT